MKNAPHIHEEVPEVADRITTDTVLNRSAFLNFAFSEGNSIDSLPPRGTLDGSTEQLVDIDMALIHQYLMDPSIDMPTQEGLIRIIGATGGSSSISVLCAKAFADPHYTIQQAIITSLYAIGGPEAIQALATIGEHHSCETTRSAAVNAREELETGGNTTLDNGIITTRHTTHQTTNQ